MCRYVFMQQLTVASSRLCRSRTSMTHNIDLDFLYVLYVCHVTFCVQTNNQIFPVSGKANHLVMDARSAMRPCYILPMFFIYFLWPP